MQEKNKKAFLDFEGDSYFKRNHKYLSNFKSKNDVIIKLIDEYSLKFNTICELGCSAGGRLNFIYNNYKHERIIGVDPSEKAINFGKKINKNISYFKGTSDNLEFISSQSIDLLIVGFFLYVVDRELLLKSVAEIDRILKRNGKLIVIDFYSSTPSISNYKHLPKENGQLYKQNYYKIFLSTKEYELIDFRSLDCKSMKLNSTNNSNELVSATLLRKSFNRLRI